MKLKHFSLLFTIVGIFFLYFLSELSHPPLVGIYELPDYEGKQVITEGIVTEYQLTKHGGQIITIKDDNSTVAVFLEGAASVEYGDKIQVTGDVQKYKDEWEIMINDKRALKILEKWQNISFPLWQLAENPDRYINLNVNVTGHIESISNAFFYLVDLEKKHSLIVFYKNSDNVTIFPGQKVSTSGIFTFDQENFRYQLEICDENHKITPLNQE